MGFDKISDDAHLLRNSVNRVYAIAPKFKVLAPRLQTKDLTSIVFGTARYLQDKPLVLGLMDESSNHYLAVRTDGMGYVVYAGDYDGVRNLTGPVVTYHVKGFDMIDFELTMLATTRDEVIRQFNDSPEMVETSGLTPVFTDLLESTWRTLVEHSQVG